MSTQKINPTYVGYIGSTKDALLIIQACLNNQLLTVPRRPHDRERSQLISSGNVFVFIEERSGIKRWTDGVAWSPSRILGRFLVYRELDRQALNNKDKSKYNDKKKIKKKSVDLDTPLQFGSTTASTSSVADTSPTNLNNGSNTAIANRSLVGSLVTSYAFKEYGLIKKTLSLSIHKLDVTNHQTIQETIHLVSYYSAEDVLNGKLQRPCDSSNLSKIQLSNELWNAVKESSLGGKIPIEDEAFYFMDQSNPNAIALGFNPAIHLQPQYQQHQQQQNQQQNLNKQQQQQQPPPPQVQIQGQNSYPLPTSNQPTTTTAAGSFSLSPPIHQDPTSNHQPMELQNLPMFYQYPRYSPSISYTSQTSQGSTGNPGAGGLPPPTTRRHTTQASPISPSSPNTTNHHNHQHSLSSSHNHHAPHHQSSLSTSSTTTSSNPFPPPLPTTSSSSSQLKTDVSPILKQEVNYNTIPSFPSATATSTQFSTFPRDSHPSTTTPSQFQFHQPYQQPTATTATGQPLSSQQQSSQPLMIPSQPVFGNPAQATAPQQGPQGQFGAGRWFGYDENGYVGYQFGQNH